MLGKILESRGLQPLLILDDGRPVTPDLWPERRRELLERLRKNLYGYTPEPPARVDGRIRREDTQAYAGKVIERHVDVTFETPAGDFTFPLHLFIPKAVPRAPVFLHIAFRPDLPDCYTPIEELTDGGFALALFCYTDIINDNHFGDFSDGLGRCFMHAPRRPDEWGKIGMWAYAASRALDYLGQVAEVDARRVAVVGHSRLGKTALWCAAQDERFWAGISNNSGFGGAAAARHGQGERIADFITYGSWDWFCENFKTFSGREDDLPYDQHMLLALLAPRLLSVGSAALDRGADPESEFLSALAAAKVWDLLGCRGLATPDAMPAAGDFLADGRVGYHLRAGLHYFSREDWGRYMAFLRFHRRQED